LGSHDPEKAGALRLQAQQVDLDARQPEKSPQAERNCPHHIIQVAIQGGGRK
jgi:hypothetical protein